MTTFGDVPHIGVVHSNVRAFLVMTGDVVNPNRSALHAHVLNKAQFLSITAHFSCFVLFFIIAFIINSVQLPLRPTAPVNHNVFDIMLECAHIDRYWLVLWFQDSEIVLMVFGELLHLCIFLVNDRFQII